MSEAHCVYTSLHEYVMTISFCFLLQMANEKSALYTCKVSLFAFKTKGADIMCTAHSNKLSISCDNNCRVIEKCNSLLLQQTRRYFGFPIISRMKALSF